MTREWSNAIIGDTRNVGAKSRLPRSALDEGGNNASGSVAKCLRDQRLNHAVVVGASRSWDLAP